jgi:predicted nucleic acid-binding protein
MRWLQALERSTTQGNTRIVYPGEDSDHEARQLLHRFSDQKLSYVDAVSLVVASREAIDAIFAFDHHLGLTGRVLVPGLID